MMGNVAKGFFYGSVSATTYGLIPLFALPIMAKGMLFDSILCYRFFIAAFALAGLIAIRRQSFRVTGKQLLTLSMLGCLFALSAIFLFWSYSLMAAGIASTILFIYPVFVALIMGILFKEKISWLIRLAIGIALVGVGLLYIGDGDGSISIAGIVIVLLSALTYAIYLVVINKSNVSGMDGFKVTFYAMIVAMLLLLLKAQFSGGLQVLPDWGAVIYIVLLGFIPTVISCVAMVSAVHHIGSTYTAVLGAMEPLTAVCVGVWIFGEPLTFSLAVGIFLIVCAVILIVLSGTILKRIHSLKYILARGVQKK